jgi:hypothetical protein
MKLEIDLGLRVGEVLKGVIMFWFYYFNRERIKNSNFQSKPVNLYICEINILLI